MPQVCAAGVCGCQPRDARTVHAFHTAALCVCLPQWAQHNPEDEHAVSFEPPLPQWKQRAIE